MNSIVSLRTRNPLITTIVAGCALASPFLAHSQSITPQHTSSPPKVAAPTRVPWLKKALAHSSLAFEANKGQTDKQVRFFTHGQDYTLFLSPTRAVFDFQEETFHKTLSPKNASASLRTHHHVLSMQLAGAAVQPAMEGVGLLPGKANYFIGHNPKQWHTNIATYDKVRYRSVYPGVDLLYYGNQQKLEYDFIVAPHHDPGQIAFRMQGARNLKLDGHGDLVIGLPKGEIRWHKPVLYQEIQGHRKSVAGHYRLRGNRIAFAVADYDRGLPLVIDPQLVYSTYLGGSPSVSGGATTDRGNGIATYTDSTYNTYVYVTGTTTSANFPTKSAYQTSPQGSSDVFITKMDLTKSGSRSVVWSTYLGGSGGEQGNAIAVDSAGNAYVAGSTWSSDLLPTASNFPHGFVAKLDAGGSTLSYVLGLSTNATEEAYGIALDSTGNIWVTGNVHSAGSNYFPASTGYQQTFGGGNYDAFAMRISSSGTANYCTFLGGGGTESGSAIAVDSSGRAYVTGNTDSGMGGAGTFPTVSPLQGSLVGNTDAFVTVIDASLPRANSVVYSSYLGSSGTSFGNGITVDSSGNAYVVGSTTSSTGFPTNNAYQSTISNTSSGAAFLCKFASLTSTPSLAYGTLLGGGTSSSGSNASAYGVAVDTQGCAYITGDSGDYFPVTSNASQSTNKYAPTQDAFVTKIDTTKTGSASLIYSTYIGGTESDYGKAIALDRANSAYITGYTSSYYNAASPTEDPYPTTSSAYQGTYTGGNGGYNAFISQLFTPSVGLTAPFDFNGDGANDLLFQNTSNVVVVVYMEGNQYLGGSSTSINPASPYKVVGVADFDGDGHPDILFQNTSTGVLVIWYMNGVTVTGSTTLSATPASGYTVAGIGDFDGDGHPDILFQNTSTGALVIWYMGGTNGSAYLGGTALSSSLPSGYTVAGVGAFGTTSQPSIVLQNSSGAVTFWLMGGVGGSTVASTATLSGIVTSLPSGYQIVAIADYNGDGHTDLVLQNGTSVLFSFMNGTSVTGIQVMSTPPVSGYNVVAPH